MAAPVIQMPGTATWGARNIAPRPPIVFNPKSGNAELPASSYMENCRAWRYAARSEALETLKMNPERDLIRNYTDFLEGRYYGNSRARYRSRFFENRLAEARLSNLCALTDIRPSMEVSSMADIPQYTKQAQILNKTIQSIWDTENLDLATEAAVDHAQLSVGYWKIGATMATETMPARVIVLPCGLDAVLPIQPGGHIQDSTAVLYRVFKPLHRVQQAYGHAADGLEREITGSFLQFIGGSYPDSLIPDYQASPLNPNTRMQPAGRAGISMASESGPFASVEVEEYWIDDPTVNESNVTIQVKNPLLPLESHNYHYLVPPGERLFPRKRLMVWAGMKLLYDGPAPYWHGLFPFSQLTLRPAVWRIGGISAYRNLVPLQFAMNEVGAGVLDLCKRAVDPQMAYCDGAMDDTSFRNFYPDRHGAQIKLNSNARWGEHAKYVDNPQLPAYVGAFVQRVDQAFDRQSGAIDTQTMANKGQVPSGEVWEQVRDAAGTVHRLDARHIEPFMRDAGTQFVSNIFQYFSREQRMWMLGKDGITWEDFDYNPGTMVPWYSPKEDHWRRFPVRVTPGSTLGSARDREKQLNVSLFRLGGTSRKDMLRSLGKSETQIAQIEQEIQEQNQGSLEPKATGKGATPRLTRSARTGGL